MGDFLAHLIEIIAELWRGDSAIRDQSVLGQSDFDRRNRRWVAWLCGGAIALLVVGGLLWWWFTRAS